MDRGGDRAALGCQHGPRGCVLGVAQDAARDRLTVDPFHYEAASETVGRLQQQYRPGDGHARGCGRLEERVLGRPVGRAGLGARISTEDQRVPAPAGVFGVEQPGLPGRPTGHPLQPVDHQPRAPHPPQSRCEKCRIGRRGHEIGRYSSTPDLHRPGASPRSLIRILIRW